MASGEHNDRSRRPAPNLSAHIQTFGVGKPEIEDDEIGADGCVQIDSIARVFGLDDARGVEYGDPLDGPANRGVILDDEHSGVEHEGILYPRRAASQGFRREFSNLDFLDIFLIPPVAAMTSA